MKKPNLKHIIALGQERAQRLNKIGMTVRLILDDGSPIQTKLVSLPWQLGHGQWVANLEGKSGGYDVLRILPV